MDNDVRRRLIEKLKQDNAAMLKDTEARRSRLPRTRESSDDGIQFSEPVETQQAFDWNAWCNQRIAEAIHAEREFMLQVIGDALGEALGRERKRDKSDLAQEVNKLWTCISEIQETIRALNRVNASEGKPMLNLLSRSVN
jgi:hypothetical protein